MRRLLLAFAMLLAPIGATATPAVAQEQTGDDNLAVAINTEDGGSVFRLAFSVRMVHNRVVDQTNAAVALASCTDCQTVALAFQVVLISGDADVVAPTNLALAYNDECVECVTYASATQIVLGFDGHLRLDGDGRRRLAELHRSLSELDDLAPEMTLSELNAAVQSAKQELIEILQTSLVVWETPSAPDDPGASTSTSTTVDGTTSTTADEDTTSTTEDTTTTTESTTSSSTPDTTTTTPPSSRPWPSPAAATRARSIAPRTRWPGSMPVTSPSSCPLSPPM